MGSFSVELNTLQSRGYDVETYVIGLVNGQEKLTRASSYYSSHRRFPSIAI